MFCIQQFFFHFSETCSLYFHSNFYYKLFLHSCNYNFFFLLLFLYILKGLLNKDRLNFCTYLTTLFAQHNLAALSFQWFSAILSRFIAYMEHFWYSLLLKRWKLIFKLTSRYSLHAFTNINKFFNFKLKLNYPRRIWIILRNSFKEFLEKLKNCTIIFVVNLKKKKIKKNKSIIKN